MISPDRRRERITLGVFVVLFFVACSAWSQVAGYPAFIPDTPGAVARLDVTTNGHSKLVDVIPQDWLDLPGDAGRNVIHPWSSLSWDYERRLVYSAGNGGHAATFNNWTFRFDFNGTTTAGGWTAIDGSPVSAIADSANSYGDGRWTSVHSYTGQLVHPDGRLFRFGGSRNTDGSNVNALWSFQPALAASPGLAYRNHGNGGLSVNVFGAIAVYAPRYGKILVVNPNQGQYAVFDPVASRWSTPASNCSATKAPNAGASGAYDTLHDRLVVLGNGINRVFKFDGKRLTNASAGNVLVTAGDTVGIIGRFAPAIAFDPECVCYWAMDLSSNGSSEPNPDYGLYLWRIDIPNALTAAYRFTRTRLSGTRIDSSFPGTNFLNQPRGGYGKIGVLRGWDAIGVVHKVADAVYVIRKPSANSCTGTGCRGD